MTADLSGTVRSFCMLRARLKISGRDCERILSRDEEAEQEKPRRIRCDTLRFFLRRLTKSQAKSRRKTCQLFFNDPYARSCLFCVTPLPLFGVKYSQGAFFMEDEKTRPRIGFWLRQAVLPRKWETRDMPGNVEPTLIRLSRSLPTRLGRFGSLA